MNSDLNDILAIALGWHRDGKKAALATVIETWGSAPRAVGSQLVVSGQGELQGSVSGGCVEGAVVVEALEALEDGAPRCLEYGVSDNEAFAVGLACGGTIRILVEPVGQAMPEALLAQLVEARAQRIPIGYSVDLETWDRGVLHPGDLSGRFRSDRSGFEDNAFVTIHNPPLRLAVIGAVHIAQTLVPMARSAGFAPIVIDPRTAFATPERFPEETLVSDWPDQALLSFEPDMRSAIVTLTHDPKLDDPAIEIALQSACFYLGCLGSSRTHSKRVARLQSKGFTDAQIARIHGPVGLDIGAKSPSEIAVSILAEIIAQLRQA